MLTTTEHSILGNVVVVPKHWPTGSTDHIQKDEQTSPVVIPPIQKPAEDDLQNMDSDVKNINDELKSSPDGEIVNIEDGKSTNGEEEREISGNNIALTDLLENKPIHIQLSTTMSNQIQKNDGFQDNFNIDNKDLRVSGVDNDGDVS